jgi:hypothetical protein
MTHERHVMRRGLLAGLLLVLGSATAFAAESAQKTFPTQDAAAQALVAAVKANDQKALLEILGGDAQKLIASGDPVSDEAARERFVQSYGEAHEFVTGQDGETILQTGKDQWPLPIPLVNTAEGWRFDTAAGQDEMITRRIGKNELDTIQTCLAYVDAQREYFAENPSKEKLRQYAQKVSSSQGKKDGLYWQTADGEPESPLGALFAQARAQGYTPGSGKPMPYHGYFYRILTAQGPHAPDGAYDYLVRGKMIGGFALVAYPAVWSSSGVMTFIVNHDGVVYEKNLGPGTSKVAPAMKTFDPDESWVKVADAANPASSPSAPPGAAAAAAPSAPAAPAAAAPSAPAAQ